MSNPSPHFARRTRFAVGLVVFFGLVASACSSRGSDADEVTVTEPVPEAEATVDETATAQPEDATPTPEPAEPPAEATPEPDDGDTNDLDAEELRELGYLPADDVDAYIAAYETAVETSYLSVDGEQDAIVSVEPGEVFAINTATSGLQVVFGDEGIEDAALLYSDAGWQLASEPVYSAVPDELDEVDGEGDILQVSFTVANVDDTTETAEVELLLDVNLVGGGNSVVETRDNYAVIAGTLGTSTYIQFRDIIATQPEIDTLVLTNVEGSENDEINVHTARLIRDAGWTTWVGANGDISSGGVDMFAAGVNRYVEPGGFVGVHSWAGDDGTVGSDFPRDHPAHRSQLEYFREMLGTDAGPEFYFYTLEAAPAESIYRMTPEEIVAFDLTTGEPPAPLSSDVVGDFGAGYLELFEGTYLKLLVESCTIDGDTGQVDLFSPDLGEVAITVADGVGEMTFTDLGSGLADHSISGLTVAEGNLLATVDLDFAALVDGDTSNAQLALPCSG